MRKKKHRFEIVLLIALSSLTTIWGSFALYCGFCYQATPEAKTALVSQDGVEVTQEKWLYSFVPETSLSLSYVFYPGGKVAAEAYAPFCLALAKKGNPVYLCVMPFNLAFFDGGAASRIIGKKASSAWVLIGHSLGGAFAGEYAAQNASKLKGVVFLASYTAKDLSETSLTSLSIYGSEDGVMDRSKYQKYATNLPANRHEMLIQGGNHASFGMYGKQSGDGEAKITSAEQIRQSVDAISLIRWN